MPVLLRWITVALVGGAGVGGTAVYFYTSNGSEVTRVFGDVGSVSICSFNVQFIGISPTREELPLADVVDDCDIVVVQELVSPPRAGTFPNGDPFNPDTDSDEYFTAMEAEGVDWVLSEEDTGTNNTLVHNNGFATEWFVAFYKPGALRPLHPHPAREALHVI